MEKKKVLKSGTSVPSLRKKTLEKASDLRTNLVKSLRALETSLDTEGLIFLLDAGKKWLAKQEALAHREKLEEEQKDVPLVKTEPTPPDHVEILGTGNGKIFTVVTPKGRSNFGLPEIGVLLKRTSGGTEPEQKAALFSWLKKERGDFLMNNGISSASNPILGSFLKVLKKSFKPK